METPGVFAKMFPGQRILVHVQINEFPKGT